MGKGKSTEKFIREYNVLDLATQKVVWGLKDQGLTSLEVATHLGVTGRKELEKINVMFAKPVPAGKKDRKKINKNVKRWERDNTPIPSHFFTSDGKPYKRSAGNAKTK